MALVAFADHRPLPEGLVGHPPGLEWFCARHVRAARRQVDLPLDDAMRRIRLLRTFGLA